jgi:hypothetical protein
MKGMFAILGCLFAAYAAPLFGNEVPLILEETIQLPVVTPYWDVAPLSSGEFYWFAAYEDSGETADVVMGYTANGNTQLVIDDAYGVPNGFACWLGESYQPICALSSRREWPATFGGSCFGDSDRTVFTVKDCENNVILNTWTQLGHDRSCAYPGSNGNSQTTLNSRFAEVFPVPPPPEAAQFVMANIVRMNNSSSYSQGSGSSNQSDLASLRWNIQDSLSERSLAVSGHGSADICLLGDSLQISFSTGGVGNSIPIGNCSSAFQLYFFHPDGDSFRAYWNSPVRFFMSSQSCSRNVIPSSFTLNVTTGESVCLTEWGYATAAIYTSSDTLPLCETSERYARSFALHVLPLEVDEQFLALRSDRVFDIYKIDSCLAWGQSSPLDSGYTEMKIIGRYHNETRRLVVRYGTELRIYRFGEPILTDADDARPELPQELTLSAYPNPFNPTTTIAFDLPKASHASLTLYDLTGRQVRTLIEEQMSAGHHQIAFDGGALPSGIYFARLNAGNMTQTQKLVLLK